MSLTYKAMMEACLEALTKFNSKRDKVNQEDFIKVCVFLAKEGYLDDDWWCEKPTALERYLSEDI